MTVNSAAFMHFIGTRTATVLVGVNFFNTIVSASRGIVPAMALVPCVVCRFAAIGMTVFF